MFDPSKTKSAILKRQLYDTLSVITSFLSIQEAVRDAAIPKTIPLLKR